MNLRIKRKFTTISKPTLPKIKPAARGMKPERQAEVDSIPPAKAGLLRKSRTLRPGTDFVPSGSSSEAAAPLARTVSKVPAQARIIARIIDKNLFIF